MAAHRSTRRRRFDDDHDHDHDTPWELVPVDGPAPTDHGPGPDRPHPDGDTVDEPVWSTYRDAQRGPTPPPAWVVTDPRAVDVDHGVVKTGKEADVSLVERSVPTEHLGDAVGSTHALLAAKRYRSAEHRLFHRDAGYLEGRRVRKSREMRAMANRTDFGRDLIAGQWAAAEFAILSLLWQRSAAVPYPVQLIGTELMMEFIGSPDGVAAPRLAQTRPDRQEGIDLYRQMTAVLLDLADAGYAHGDLSPYNVLVHDGRLVLIDLPQVVDLVGNPQGPAILRRDCVNICSWFSAHGIGHADAVELYDELWKCIPGET